MFGEHHDLESDLPEYGERIAELLSGDPRFAQLYAEYNAVDDEIYRIEEQIETPSDLYTEEVKKRRVRLKDELYEILRAGA